MNVLRTSLVILSIFLVSACNSKKTTADAEATAKEKISAASKKMMEEGFKQGVIVISRSEGDCPVKIKMDDAEMPYHLDPINIDEYDTAFKQNDTKIWFTYQPLRMMNRCEGANPVNLTAIQKREE